MIVDRKCKEVCVGRKVIWYDPEESARDLSRTYNVDKIINEEMILISDDYSEAEVNPCEIEVV